MPAPSRAGRAVTVGAGGGVGTVTAREEILSCQSRTAVLIRGAIESAEVSNVAGSWGRRQRDELGFRGGQQPADLVAGGPSLVPGPAGSRVSPLGEAPGRARSSPAAPQTHPVETEHMAVENAPGIEPQQAIHDIRGTVRIF
jgi:hypothetical protein